MQAFKSTLFDPSTGIFGLMRDLRPDEKGAQSAFKSMNEVLIELIGENGLFNQVGKVLKAAGVQLMDPMELLKSGADAFANSLRWVNRTLSLVTNFLEFTGSLEATFAQLPSIMGISGITPGKLATALGKGMSSLLGQLTSLLGGTGNLVAVVKPYVESGIDRVRLFITTALVELPKAIGPFIQGGFTKLLSMAPVLLDVLNNTVPVLFLGIGSFLSTNLTRLVDFVAPLMNKQYQAMVSFLQNLDVYGISVALGASVGQMLGVAVDFLSRLDYGALLMIIGQLAIGAVAGIAGFIGGVGIGILPGLWKGIVNIGKGIGDGFTTFMLAINQTFIDALNLLPPDIANVLTIGFKATNVLLTNGWGAFIDYINKALTSGLDYLKQIGERIISPLRNVPIIGGMLPQPPTTANAATAIAAAPTAVGAMFNGHVPNAAGGLMDAARRESAAMPRNAQVVVANNKEYILQPRGTTSVGRGGNTFQISINGANHSPAEIAQLVLEAIEQTFTDEQTGQLA
jgi:hypothetical protein